MDVGQQMEATVLLGSTKRNTVAPRSLLSHCNRAGLRYSCGSLSNRKYHLTYIQCILQHIIEGS